MLGAERGPLLTLAQGSPHPCLEPLQPRTLEGTWEPRRAWNRIIPAQVVCVPCQVLPAPRPEPSSLGSSGPFRPVRGRRSFGRPRIMGNHNADWTPGPRRGLCLLCDLGWPSASVCGFLNFPCLLPARAENGDWEEETEARGGDGGVSGSWEERSVFFTSLALTLPPSSSLLLN